MNNMKKKIKFIGNILSVTITFLIAVLKGKLKDDDREKDQKLTISML